jgi:DNA-binding NarL/FixJ family response regulator
MKIFIVDPHQIYRQGIVASLRDADGVSVIGQAGSVEAAWADEALADADVALVDQDLEGRQTFIRELRGRTSASVLVCSSRRDPREVMGAVEDGALGYLCKDSLTPESLIASVRTAAAGAGVLAPELLGDLLRSVTRTSRELLEPRGLSLSLLTEREQLVLTLLSQGHPTREVAKQLSYSERTVKNVIHDVVTKFNARSRTQAVAAAVRQGLI